MSGKDRIVWRAMLWPVWPTRAHFEAALGHDPARLQRLADQCWRLFRVMTVACAAGWLVIVGTMAAVAWAVPADERAWAWRMGLVATALFGAAVTGYYPWPFRDQGSRWVRWAVLAVGVPAWAGLVWQVAMG